MSLNFNQQRGMMETTLNWEAEALADGHEALVGLSADRDTSEQEYVRYYFDMSEPGRFHWIEERGMRRVITADMIYDRLPIGRRKWIVSQLDSALDALGKAARAVLNSGAWGDLNEGRFEKVIPQLQKIGRYADDMAGVKAEGEAVSHRYNNETAHDGRRERV